MKALDSSVLRAVLSGEPAGGPLLLELRGEEVATTEISFLELASLANQGPHRGRGSRREALARLRRKLTVLPIDARAGGEAARRAPARASPADLARLAEWGALEAYGCDELFTLRRARLGGKWRFKVTIVDSRRSK